MRITVTLNNKLLSEAAEYTGLTNESELMNVALRALIQREAARRLALLGGTEPRLRSIPRRRSVPSRKVAAKP